MTVRFEKLKEPVLVTGAAGFIGRRLVMRLLDEGLSVVAFDLIACPESLEIIDELTWIQGDITSYQDVASAVDQCATIFHLAAVVGDWGLAEIHEQVTVGGTRNIFEAARKGNGDKRIVLASSIVVYGHQLNGVECHEGVIHGDSHGPYSECKQAQERLAQEYSQRGLDIRIVRPANVYGAGSKPWVEELSLELKRGVPTLVAGGEYDAGLVHVENVIEIMWRAARHPNAKGQIYNAADEEGISWKQYMTDLAKICDAPKPRSIPRVVAVYLAKLGETAFGLLRTSQRPPLTREALNIVGADHRIDIAKAKTELDYTPIVSYEEGIAEIKRYLHA